MNSPVIVFVLLVCLAPFSDVWGEPFGSGGVDYIKPIRYLVKSEGSRFYEIKCRIGQAQEVLYEPNNAHQWFSVPPSEPLEFYVGASTKSFGVAACGEKDRTPESSVKKITGGVGATASGLKTYDVTCKDGEMYTLQNSRDGEWWNLNKDGRLDRLAKLNIERVSEVICRDGT